jgi:hypothetical protein
MPSTDIMPSCWLEENLSRICFMTILTSESMKVNTCEQLRPNRDNKRNYTRTRVGFAVNTNVDGSYFDITTIIQYLELRICAVLYTYTYTQDTQKKANSETANLTALQVSMKNVVFWDVTPRGSCKKYFFAACVGC